MSEQDEIYNGVKVIVSKLHVLRDSCKGVYSLERSSLNLIWFQGAASLIQQGIDHLQNTLQAIDEGLFKHKGGERMDNEVYNNVEDIVSKLFVLRDSCKGLYHSEKSDPNVIWFQGAASILQEAIDELQDALQAIDKQTATGPEAAEEETISAVAGDKGGESSEAAEKKVATA